MEEVVFNQLDDAIEKIFNYVDLLESENKTLKSEIENLLTNHREEKNLIEMLQKEKSEVTQQFQNSQLGKAKEEQIKIHIDNILKKLDELQVTLQ